MEKFIVSARKYRPQTFDTVVGQQHITTTLKNAIKNNQLAHAFLFCGPRGVGKTTCARILAKTINCENLQHSGEACNVCNSCKSFNEGTSLNIHELDAASNNSVDDIRSLVEQVRFAPQAGKYKVYIVDEVHMLSASAFNAFLKTLEEPPPYAIFILATTEKHKILPTILSRCQIFDFKRITTADTVDHLQQIANKENIKTEKQALHIIAQKSEGCMRDSLSILDKIVSFTNGELTYQNTLEHLNILDEDYYFKLLSLLQQQNIAGAMLLFDEINSKGFDGDMLLNGFAEFMRNLLVARNKQAIQLLDVAETIVDKYVETANILSLAYMISMLNVLNETEINYKMARNKRLHVELALIKLAFLQQAVELAADNNTVVRKKRVDGPVAVKTATLTSMQAQPSSKKTAEETKLFIKEPAKVVATVDEKVNDELIHNGVQKQAEPVFINQPKEHSKTKKNLLDTLREQCGDRYKVEEIREAEPLTLPKLKQVWFQYSDKLEEQKKQSSAITFRSANIKIEEDNFFTVQVHSQTQHNFIQQERAMLNDVLQAAFCNRSVHFSIVIDEGHQPEIPLQQKLNSRQRLEHIAKEYPLVMELKNRLNLDLDY